jgi:hypothetical protein
VRTWGRNYSIPPSDTGPGTYTWVEVDTQPDGSNDYVWLTTLIQCLKLTPGESPFYAQYGIPARQSVMMQIQPDFDVAKTQAQFAGHFASLQIVRQPATFPPKPTYQVNVILNNGTALQVPVV